MQIPMESEVPDEPCVFCAIVSGEGSAFVVHETDRTLGVLDINPATGGHTLVIPKRHAADLWSISPEDFRAVADATRAVARLIRERLAPDGLTLFQANRRAGWQDVFHLHMHVVPRYDNDTLVRPWTSSPEGRAGLADVAERLTDGTSSGPCSKRRSTPPR